MTRRRAPKMDRILLVNGEALVCSALRERRIWPRKARLGIGRMARFRQPEAFANSIGPFTGIGEGSRSLETHLTWLVSGEWFRETFSRGERPRIPVAAGPAARVPRKG